MLRRAAAAALLLAPRGVAAAGGPRRVSVAVGVDMPVVSNGFITGYPSQRGPGTASFKQTEQALLTWFQVGGRGLDTAWKYRNQEAYGSAIQKSGVPRSEIFVTTKIPCVGSSDAALQLVREDVQKLGTYADAVIIHGTGMIPPFPPGDPAGCWDDGSPGGYYKPCCQDMAGIQATYHGLERALAENLTRAIGVSSFQTKHLEGVLATATVPPAINQCQHYVGGPASHNNFTADTIAFCKQHGITYMAFSPLGNGGNKSVLVDPVVKGVAAAHSVSSAQVGMAWVQQQGMTLVTASSSEQYDREDLAIAGITLTGDEMARLSAV